MAKAVVKLEQTKSHDSKDYSQELIRKALSEQNACYVLITCGAPSPDGKMEVEMTYEGDETLAAYLVDNAQQVFDARSRSSQKSH